MDIIIQRETLLKPLQVISSIAEKKQTLPILSNVLLSIKNKKLYLFGTDMEVELVGFVEIDSILSEGMITVCARKLFDACRLSTGETVRLTLENNYLVVRAGESCFMLNTLPPQDFPSLEEGAYSSQFCVKQSHLKNLFAKTYFAMGQQDVRHYLNGVLLDIRQHAIKCVATDGHRLALTMIQDENIGDIEAKVILPRKSVLELIRLFSDERENDITVQIGESRFRVSTPEYIFTSKLINAQYPDYNRLIPKGNAVAVGDREVIKQALTRASILLTDKFRGIRFQLEVDKLRITANNESQEQADEAISLEYAGKSIEIGFNVAYLLDAISAITAKTIRCVFTGPSEGVLIESAEDDQSLYVVMPMLI